MELFPRHERALQEFANCEMVTAQQLAKSTEWSKEAARNALEGLRHGGLVVKLAPGKYELQPAGRHALSDIEGYKNQADKEKRQFAAVSWNIADVLDLRPEWTEEQCYDFLCDNQKWIQEAMTERGWAAIIDLLPERELKSFAEPQPKCPACGSEDLEEPDEFEEGGGPTGMASVDCLSCCYTWHEPAPAKKR